jgi:predicted DCC family thiol-disulfide oxidoreductase YuxK
MRRTNNGAPQAPDGHLTTFYNGACPICRREMEHYRRLDAEEGDGALGWCDVAQAPDALAAFGIGAEAAKRRLHVVDGDGRLHAGIDAFILLWEQMPRYRGLARLARLPVVHGIAAWGYEHVVAAAFYRWARRLERHAAAR